MNVRGVVGVLLLFLTLVRAADAADGRAVLIESADASVTEEPGGRSWSIGTSSIRLQVGLDDAGLLVIQAIENVATGESWPVGASPDLSFTSQARKYSPGQLGFPFRSASADEYRGGVRLRLAFDLTALRLRVVREYLCYPGVPAVETWTTLTALDGGVSVAVSDMGLWQVSVGVRDVHWVTGLGAPEAEGGRFTRRHQVLSPFAPFTIGSTTRSSTLVVPTVWFSGQSGQFFGALLWSGAWSIAAAGPEESGLTAVRASLGSTTRTITSASPLETPHGIFGVTGAEDTAVTLAVARYASAARQYRPLPSLVTYNTWFAYGTRVNEAAMRAELVHAAALGAEVFVLDAGWYAGGTGVADFTTGLGNWTADRAKFPNGLRALRDYAHELGIKFGLWVEPERVDTATVGRSGLARERFLATTGGRYNPGVSNSHAGAAQLCLGDAEARQWILGQLQRLIDEVQPDYLKWDNNDWVNCDRLGHGHGTGDGNYAHTAGLYDLLAALRARYPDLVIENCASGGNRLDLGMLSLTDVAWMDDVTGPSWHVRHNAEGLGAVFPVRYLLSFVIDDPAEPLHGAADMAMYFRSRMLGVLGLTFVGAEFGEDDVEAMRREVERYKAVRSPGGDAVMTLLTDQVRYSAGGTWDLAALSSPATADTALFAFVQDGAEDQVTVRLPRLQPETTYVVKAPGGKAIGVATGRDLMDAGLTVRRLPFTSGYLLTLTPAPPVSSPTNLKYPAPRGLPV